MGSTRLSNEEKSTLNYLSYALSSELEEDQIDAIKLLGDLDAEMLLKFSNENTTIKACCETNPDLHKIWSERLKNKGSPHSAIASKDWKISIWDHYISDFLMMEYSRITSSSKEAPYREALLNKACELGSYSGLIIRCQASLSKLNNPKETDKEKCILQMKQDADSLGTLYETVGRIRAGCVNVKLAGVLMQSADNEAKVRGATYFENAVAEFLCGLQLYQDENSKPLIDCLTKGEGVKAIFKEQNIEFDFDKPKEMKKIFVQWVGRETYGKIDTAVQQKFSTGSDVSSCIPRVT